MRILWSLSAIAVASSSVSAFAPSNTVSRQTAVYSTVAVAGADVKAKQEATLTKMAARDQQSSSISKDVSYSDGCGVGQF